MRARASPSCCSSVAGDVLMAPLAFKPPGHSPSKSASGSTRQVHLAGLALAVGGFGIGTGEFGIMGLLADVGGGIGVAIALAGRAWARGGFGIGTGEFGIMGLLPDVAGDIGVSIPLAGHVISAYAVGVVVGAPVIAVLAARLPRRMLLVALMTAFAAGNFASALASDYGWLVLLRVSTGLPHRSYFG